MRDAIVHGNRLIMMKDGQIILDIRGEEKKNLTVEHLLHQFEAASGGGVFQRQGDPGIRRPAAERRLLRKQSAREENPGNRFFKTEEKL